LDLGISGRRALVCGASSGLGRAIAEALAAEGVNVLMVARGRERLEAVAGAMNEESPGAVEWLAADVANGTDRAAILKAANSPDILVTNAGGPPVGDYRKLDRKDWLAALEGNMLSAIELINGSLDAMIDRAFGRILNITSHMVKSPVAHLSLSNGARAGLTGFVAGVARDVMAHGVTINNLLPGQFSTPRLQVIHENFAKSTGRTVENIQTEFLRQIPANRFGRPEEFGATAAFLCSLHAGFITGQNILLDGGQYPGLL